MARFPPLFPSAPFPVWVTVWVSGFPAQDLHRYKQERASCLKFREGEAILSSTAQATHCRPGFWGHQFTHCWVGQAEHLACRKRQPGAFAGAARTHSGRRAGRPREGPLSRPCRPCVPLSGGERDHTDAPIEAARPHENSEEEYLRGPRFGPFGGVRFSY